MINVGDTVVLTRAKSRAHFLAAGMSIVGKVVKIDESNYVGKRNRPYFLEFPDRDGEWSYSADEFRKLNLEVDDEA